MNKVIYRERKTWSKYDDTHYICYLNEEREEIPPDEGMEETLPASGAEPSPGYAYTGEMTDGGTLIEATEATYEAFTAGLIRVEYPQRRVEAIQSNLMTAFLNPKDERASEYAAEWAGLQARREWSKEQAGRIMDIAPLPAAARRLEDAIEERIAALEAYDNSPEVNGFYLGGIPCWITADERARYAASLMAAETRHRETITVTLVGQCLTLPFPIAKETLADIQLYADDAAGVTTAHREAIRALTSIEEVDAYDFTTGYPEKLTISFPE